MTHWLYPANTKYYDVFGAMADKETWWPMHTRVEAGDAVLIYLAAPYKQIGFFCDVTATGFDSAAITPHVRRFLKDEPKPEKAAKPFMTLCPTLSIPINREGPLGISHLKQRGLTGMLMGPRNLDNNPRLLEYILDHIKGQ